MPGLFIFMIKSREPHTYRHGKPPAGRQPGEPAVGLNRRGGSAAGGQRGWAPREEGGRWVRGPDRTAAFPGCEAAGADVASRKCGPRVRAEAGEVTRSHARLRFRLRRVLPPPGLRGAGSERVPASSPNLGATLGGPQAPRGLGLGAGRGREGPGKTTPIAWQWARPPGGAGSPEPPLRRAFGARGSQVLGPTWAGRCRPGGVRAGWQPGRAHPSACHAARRSHAAPHVWLRKWLESSVILPRSSSQAFVFGLTVWKGRGEKQLYYLHAGQGFRRAVHVRIQSPGSPFHRGLPSSCLRKPEPGFLILLI